VESSSAISAASFLQETNAEPRPLPIEIVPKMGRPARPRKEVERTVAVIRGRENRHAAEARRQNRSSQ